VLSDERLQEILAWHKDCECGCAEVAEEVTRLRAQLDMYMRMYGRAVEAVSEAVEEIDPAADCDGTVESIWWLRRQVTSLRAELADRDAEAQNLRAERDELAAKVADAWDEALDHAGDESHELRMNLIGETDWNGVEDLIWSHIGAMQDANPHRQAQS
jgi:DNA repair ATPase RecN